MTTLSKTYIIAGASSGIGLEIAKKLINSGNTVYALSRNAGELVNHKNYIHIKFDFLEDKALPDIPETANGLIFCPGSITLKPIERLTGLDIEKDYLINAKAAFLFIKKYLSNIKNSEDAAIVLFSTVAVQTGLPYHCSIAMAKGAIEGLTRSLAAELSPGIRVNAIAPSLTDTPLTATLLNSDAKIEANKQRHPLKTLGTAEDIASFACYLLRDLKWTTGQVFGINGGLGTIIK